MAPISIEILGSGGAVRTPRPGCQCERCTSARTTGIPWARMGPSVFVHGPNVLIDTPEDSCTQVDRAGITTIAAGLYSHWHPDHTAGRRMWETRNGDFLHWPSRPTTTPIYVPPNAARDFRERGIWESFEFKQKMGYVTVQELSGPLELGGWRITAHSVAEDYVYAFLFEEMDGLRRVLICMDELHGWMPPEHLRHVDLVVLPKGLFDMHPFTGERIIPADHPVLRSEATYVQTLEMVRTLAARKVIFMHLEEPEPFTPPEYAALAAHLRAQEGWDVTFAWDTLVVELP